MRTAQKAIWTTSALDWKHIFEKRIQMPQSLARIPYSVLFAYIAIWAGGKTAYFTVVVRKAHLNYIHTTHAHTHTHEVAVEKCASKMEWEISRETKTKHKQTPRTNLTHNEHTNSMRIETLWDGEREVVPTDHRFCLESSAPPLKIYSIITQQQKQ